MQIETRDAPANLSSELRSVPGHAACRRDGQRAGLRGEPTLCEYARPLLTGFQVSRQGSAGAYDEASAISASEVN